MREFIPLGAKEPGEPRVTVKESGGTIVVDCLFSGCRLVDNHRLMAGKTMPFKQMMMPSAGALHESGRPQLPSLGRYLQIPPGYDYEVSTQTGPAVLCDSVLVWPAQLNIRDTRDREHVFEFDEELYRSDMPYPEEIVRVRGPYHIDGTRALLIHIFPFQYNPAGRQLIGFANITITVSLKPGVEARSDGPLDAYGGREAFGRLFFNPGGGIEKRLGLPPRPPIFRLTGPELLIVHAPVLESAARNLANWKSSRGIITEIVSTDTSGHTVAALKCYIRSRRAPILSRLRYVILLGDTDTIETEKVPSFAYDYENISDYYYSTKEDPDHANPDDYVFSWLALGRIPVSDAVEAMSVVDKIIAYEKSPPGDPAYYRRMVFAAYFEDEAQDQIEDKGCVETVEAIISCLEPDYTAKRVYTTNNQATQLFYHGNNPVPGPVRQEMLGINAQDKDQAAQALVDATTEGNLIICHRGHGSVLGWDPPLFEKDHLDQVTGTMPSVFYSIECDSGKFDQSNGCFAEEVLKMKGGGPSLIASTRESYFGFNNFLIKALFDATFQNVLPSFQVSAAVSAPIRRLGDILNYAKCYLPVDGCTSETKYIKDHFEIYHVIGDPTLELWTAAPGTLTLEVKLTVDFIEILLSSLPEGCVLTIWFKGKMLKRMEPSSTRVVVPAEQLPVAPGNYRDLLRICCWAPGYRFCEKKVKLEKAKFRQS